MVKIRDVSEKQIYYLNYGSVFEMRQLHFCAEFWTIVFGLLRLTKKQKIGSSDTSVNF
jgi:hypothetical protein